MKRRPPKLPLEGYRVVEMAHHLSAPLAAMYLGDFGADVVKVETLAGEDWRRWGRPSPGGDSQLFIAINRNKRSLSIDVSSADGRAVLDRLLGSSDVLLTNWSAQVLRALGLDSRSLARRHPRLIPCMLSAFGTRGPDAGRRAFDMIVCGETGLLAQHPDGVSAPLVNTAPIADTAGSLMLAYGVTLALLHRERGGPAQAVESALVNVCIALQAHRFVWLEGDTAPEMRPPTTALYRAYPTADGFVTIAVIAERLWRRLAEALGLSTLLEDPRYMPWTNLLARQAELIPIVEARFRTRTTDEWMKTLTEAGVPAGRVNYGPAVFEHPQLHENRVVISTRHPGAGRLRMMGFPLTLHASKTGIRRHAPALGADTEAVLRELGYRAAEVRELTKAGVVNVGAPRPAARRGAVGTRPGTGR
jgi:crotonobetainyl-CoA:carnitine CoA-transferase CaiB-like acyl-CoA transferase